MPGGARANSGRRAAIIGATDNVASGVPPPPAWLPIPARRHYRHISQQLINAGVATRLDGTILAAHCAALHHMGEAERAIAQFGAVVVGPDGVPKPSPYVKIRRDAYIEVIRTSVELGLTPSSRGRTKAHPATASGGASLSPIALVMARKTAS